MGAVKEAMFEIAEELHLDFETEEDFNKIGKIWDHRHRLPMVAARCRSLRDVTRLWNWIDDQYDCEYLWSLLAIYCPWAFVDPNDVNTMKFTY